MAFAYLHNLKFGQLRLEVIIFTEISFFSYLIVLKILLCKKSFGYYGKRILRASSYGYAIKKRQLYVYILRIRIRAFKTTFIVNF